MRRKRSESQSCNSICSDWEYKDINQRVSYRTAGWCFDFEISEKKKPKKPHQTCKNKAVNMPKMWFILTTWRLLPSGENRFKLWLPAFITAVQGFVWIPFLEVQIFDVLNDKLWLSAVVMDVILWVIQSGTLTTANYFYLTIISSLYSKPPSTLQLQTSEQSKLKNYRKHI